MYKRYCLCLDVGVEFERMLLAACVGHASQRPVEPQFDKEKAVDVFCTQGECINCVHSAIS